MFGFQVCNFIGFTNRNQNSDLNFQVNNESNRKRFHDKPAEYFPHKCNLCGKRFTQKGSLNRHMITHNNVRPFGCDICPRRFKYRNVLAQHRTLHYRSSSFICNKCGQSFRYQGMLQEHQLIGECIEPSYS